MQHGLVIKNTGSWYQVRTDDGSLVECKIKGNFRLKGIRSTNPVAVGDRVTIEANREGTAFIVSIDDRENYIIRRASNLSKESHILAANIDQALLIVTVNHPQTNLIFIDRFLATAEAYRIPVKLVFNKIDLYDDDDMQLLRGLIDLYAYIGYECLSVSAATSEGVDTLRTLLRGKVSLFAGNFLDNDVSSHTRLLYALRRGFFRDAEFFRGERGEHFPRDVDVPLARQIV